MKVYFTLLLYFFALNNIIGQNLVPNGSFQDVFGCPDGGGQIFKAKTWKLPTIGTPDVYHMCYRKTDAASVPKNRYGFQKPRTGHSYAGLFMLGTGYESDYREYLHCFLTEPLEAGRKYEVEMHVALGENISRYAIDFFEIYFSKEQVYVDTKEAIDDVPTFKLRKEGGGFLDSKEWTVLRRVYKAKGGEKFITIGNFRRLPATKKKLVNANQLGENCYYYVEDILIEPVFVEEVKVGETIALENVYFEYDEADLLTESFVELDKLVKFLENHPTVEIEIAGHTDSLGSDEYNLKLSQMRTKSVAEYIYSEGISMGRVQYKGYGESKPKAPNATEEGRAMNRRVEFVILKE